MDPMTPEAWTFLKITWKHPGHRWEGQLPIDLRGIHSLCVPREWFIEDKKGVTMTPVGVQAVEDYMSREALCC